MRKLHKHLRLQHHRHTGRRLQHKHTSYRALALIVGLAGALMILVTIMAHATADSIVVNAGNIVVTARNPAPIPTTPAVILSPTDGTVVSKARVLVSGTCPHTDPAVVVVITDNGVQTASTPCTASDTFSVPIIVSPGHHTLVAESWTITGDKGPDSDPVHITRIVPEDQAHANDLSAGIAGSGNGLIVTIDEPFIIFGPAKDAIWLGTIKGGSLPYTVKMEWGDGTVSTYKLTTSGDQHFVHHYRSMRPHIITLLVTDSSGRGALQTYAAVTPYVPPVTFVGPALPWRGSLPWGLYGAYLLVLVVFGGTWARSHRSFAYAKIPARAAQRMTAIRKRRAARR